MVSVSEKNTVSLAVYTRDADAASYPDGLARSVHFAMSVDGCHFQALNQNYGILFAKAVVREDDTICPRCVKNPQVFRMEGNRYGILAVRVCEDGTADEESRGKALLWITGDFAEFEDERLIDLGRDVPVERVWCRYEEKERCYHIFWEDEAGNSYENTAENMRGDLGKAVEGPAAGPEGNTIELSWSLGERIRMRWSRIHNTEILVPEEITASRREDVERLTAAAVYSDGSAAVKNVVWETEKIDFEVPGTYEIRGEVQNEEYQFPLARGYGDPVIFRWKGKWYFIATNDNLDDIGFYVRVSDDVAGLFKEGIAEHLILGVDEEKGFVQTFWAPEFHVIGGELYILFAIGGKVWGPQCWLMRLKKDGDITKACDWEEPVRVRRKDGSWLAEDGITLDMTYLKAGENSYMVWSYRRGIGTAADTGSMLYIAAVDEREPWKLTSDPVLLSRPLYGWENVSHTINNEGPHGFVSGDRVCLTYSGGAANGYTYVLGLLSARISDDLLTVSNWKKSKAPVLSFYSVENEYGPGHNSFFEDETGNLMIAYHGETALESNLRCDGIRRVHFDLAGNPVFDLSAKRDLDPELRHVKTRVTVKK